VWRLAAACRTCMLVQYCSMTGTLAARILNSIRAATGSRCKSIGAVVTCSRRRRSQTRHAAAFKTNCSGARVDWQSRKCGIAIVESIYDKRWHGVALVPPGVPVAGKRDVDVAGGRNIICVVFKIWARMLRLRALSHASIVSWPTITLPSDDGMDCSNADEPNHIMLVLTVLSCSLWDPHQSATSAIQMVLYSLHAHWLCQ